ncbi:MAG: hypothetical protein LBT11_01895 [Treponema sp.]|jgi:hypothetical protein|nr:hypothetical protein [Treponema sp.]
MSYGHISTGGLAGISYAVSMSQGGKTSLPVSPANLIYAHFEHVSGVPAPEGSQGVSISKLKVLDVLIEQLSQIKKRPELAQSPESMSEGQVEALIAQYETQIRSIRAMALPYAVPEAPAAAVFSLNV